MLPLTASHVALSAQPYPSDNAATAFQFLPTIIVSFALVVVVVAAFSSPPRTGVLGRALGIMLAAFTLFQMIAFALMAGLVAECESDTFASILFCDACFLPKLELTLKGGVQYFRSGVLARHDAGGTRA